MAEPALTMLQAIVREVLAEPGLTLREDAATADVPGWDSVTNVEIILALEERLGVEFHVGELGRMCVVADYLRLIEARRSARTVGEA